MIEDVLAARLRDWPALSALVGQRIYPIVLPKGCLKPALTYRRAKTPLREPLLSQDSGQVYAHFVIAAWMGPETGAYDQLCEVATQVRLALQRWSDEAQGVNDTLIIDEFEDFSWEVEQLYRAVVIELDYQE